MELPDVARIADLLRPYTVQSPVKVENIAILREYLDLLLRWNTRMNLTAIRDPEDLIERQVGESLFAGKLIPATGTLLDFGSGAGFPGIPLQIVKPQLKVTLAESQGKKASFLREAARALSLPVVVWAKRVEEMPVGLTFDIVIMRAVDATEAMLPVAAARVNTGGSLIRFVAENAGTGLVGWTVRSDATIPNSGGRLIRLTREGE